MGELKEGNSRQKRISAHCISIWEFQRTKILTIKIILSKLHCLLAVCMYFSGDFSFYK